MTSTVTLPFWLALIISALAIWAAFERILLPALRWFLRRRFNRSIDELNTRLKLRIQPFKLAKRQALIDQLLFDPEVLRAIEEYAAANKVSREAAQARARDYAREIVPSFSAYAYFGIGTRLARWVSTFLYRVRLGYLDEAAMQPVEPDPAVIFVINHRSNMDYVLVTYMASTSSALSYAVGEWARVWLLQNLIRSMGAYFVRRDSREPLYRKVLSRYVHLAVAGGLTQAMFPEGGLTRDGKLRSPKLGLLSYMVSGFDPQGPRDAVFVPVGINYDRVLEDRVQVAALMTPEGEKPRFTFSPVVLLGFLASNLKLRMQGRLYRYGYACVSFGKPVSLRQFVTERGIDFRTLDEKRRFAEIEELGKTLMQRVGQVVPALPVSLVATVMLAAAKPLSALELKGEVEILIRRLIACGAHIHIPRSDQDYAIEVGLRMLLLRHFVEEQNGLYRANPREEILLRYYANSIAHLLPAGQPEVAAAAE
ncbi:MAG: glycerol-3-phosphate acyltransferase [Alphaproteobacteria bacterium]|nr:MAG: glycerol-3-phosphate acyltransferase [Alphaproteobacteria bacterium]